MMAIVTLFRFSFLLPPDSYPARTALLVTVFLCQERIEMFPILMLTMVLITILLLILIICSVMSLYMPGKGKEVSLII